MKNNWIFKSLIVIVAFVCFNVANAQEKAAAKTEVKIAKFEAGKALDKSQVSYLNAISGSKTRGDIKAASIDGKTYSVGQKLIAADVTLLDNKANDFETAHPSTDKTRGLRCWYWCDAYGYCWWRCR